MALGEPVIKWFSQWRTTWYGVLETLKRHLWSSRDAEKARQENLKSMVHNVPFAKETLLSQARIFVFYWFREVNSTRILDGRVVRICFIQGVNCLGHSPQTEQKACVLVLPSCSDTVGIIYKTIHHRLNYLRKEFEERIVVIGLDIPGMEQGMKRRTSQPSCSRWKFLTNK